MKSPESGSFYEFQKLDSESWWKKIDEDLKGKPREKLNHKPVSGIELKPFYHFDHSKTEGSPFRNSVSDWMLGQSFKITAGKEAETASLISEGIEGDANLIILKFDRDFDCDVLFSALIDFKGRIILQSSNREILWKYLNLFRERLNPEIFADSDIFNAILNSESDTLSLIGNIFEKSCSYTGTIILNSDGIRNRGADEVDEAVYVLSLLNELMKLADEKSGKLNIILRLASGSNFFVQIARLRSLRTLAEFIMNKWQRDYSLKIESHNGLWNKSVFERFNNILRLTSESFSAIAGGVDFLTVSGFENALNIENSFTHRNARNISHLLRYESHLDKVADKAAGSYYIEELTLKFSEKVWEGFQEIENAGGLTAYLSRNSLNEKLEGKAKKQKELFGNSLIKMIGTNAFPNPDDKITEETIRERQAQRLAFEFEKIRSIVEQKVLNGEISRPVATLLKLGDSSMKFARAGFATNFLECAGIKIQDSDSIGDELVNSDFAVLCSSDEGYIEKGIEWSAMIREISPDIQIIVAGNPENRKELEEKGLKFFIHLKSSLEDSLKEILKSINIETA